MALVNPLGDITLEATLRRVLAAVSFARTSTDQLRVNVDAGTLTTLGAVQWGNANVNPSFYSTGAPTSMDQREMQKMLARNNYMLARNRWAIA